MCARDVIKSETKKGTKGFILIRHKKYYKFICYFHCLQLFDSIASFGNQYILDILNFVMAVRDITLRSLLSKNIQLFRDF